MFILGFIAFTAAVILALWLVERALTPPPAPPYRETDVM